LPVGAFIVSTIGASAAGAAVKPPRYQFTVRAAAVEGFAHYFREIDSDAGFSRVQIARRSSEAVGHARAVAAPYWLLTDDAPCLLGCEPPCPESALVNPTIARTVNPRECADRVPGLGALGLPTALSELLNSGTTSRAAVTAPNAETASASAQLADLAAAGIDAAAVGSNTSAAVADVTRHYTGSARSFVTDLRLPGGRLASVVSRLSVTADPGGTPKVDYLLSLLATDGAGWAGSGVDQQSFTFAGRAIPLGDLIAAFNSQMDELASRVSALAGLGVQLLAPVVDYAPDSERFRVSAPVFLVGVTPQADLPTPTRDGGLRVGSATFEGSYAEPDPPLR
jgi:hypothetical protein